MRSSQSTARSKLAFVSIVRTGRRASIDGLTDRQGECRGDRRLSQVLVLVRVDEQLVLEARCAQKHDGRIASQGQALANGGLAGHWRGTQGRGTHLTRFGVSDDGDASFAIVLVLLGAIVASDGPSKGHVRRGRRSGQTRQHPAIANKRVWSPGLYVLQVGRRRGGVDGLHLLGLCGGRGCMQGAGRARLVRFVPRLPLPSKRHVPFFASVLGCFGAVYANDWVRERSCCSLPNSDLSFEDLDRQIPHGRRSASSISDPRRSVWGMQDGWRVREARRHAGRVQARGTGAGTRDGRGHAGRARARGTGMREGRGHTGRGACMRDRAGAVLGISQVRTRRSWCLRRPQTASWDASKGCGTLATAQVETPTSAVARDTRGS